MTRILIVDDHAILRQALKRALLSSSEFSELQCHEVKSVDDARKWLEVNQCNLVVMDISMPGMSGMMFLPELVKRYPALPVLMLSMYPEEQYALQALQFGARGYICKQEGIDDLVLAISSILQGNRYLSRSFSSNLLDQVLKKGPQTLVPQNLLSIREQEVFRKLVTGQSLKCIADETGLSIKTVSTYKKRLSNKMGFKNNADLISYGLSHSII